MSKPALHAVPDRALADAARAPPVSAIASVTAVVGVVGVLEDAAG